MLDKKVHIKSLILNYLFGLMENDDNGIYKDTILELYQEIDKL